MRVLYKNHKGRSVITHSYSSGAMFRGCRREYYLDKIVGWKQKENKASLQFGNAFEAAIQFHVNNNGVGAIELFDTTWEKVKGIKDLQFTETEGSWESMKTIGHHLIQLFSLWWPAAGLSEPYWQLEYKKPVFPSSAEYEGLEFGSYIDLRAKKDGEPIFVDIKTSGKLYPDGSGLLRLDPQLGSYAWTTGIPRSAFLVALKRRTDTLKKGDTVTNLLTGKDSIVVAYDEAADGVSLFVDAAEYFVYEAAVKGLRGKALDTVKEHFCRPRALVPKQHLTKCRLQWLTDTIPSDIIAERGQIIGQQIVDINRAWEDNCWPQDGAGIRFPNNRCLFCSKLGICSGNDELRDKMLIKLGDTAPEENPWFEDMEGD